MSDSGDGISLGSAAPMFMTHSFTKKCNKYADVVTGLL
jgi:hypothetical protein